MRKTFCERTTSNIVKRSYLYGTMLIRFVIEFNEAICVMCPSSSMNRVHALKMFTLNFRHSLCSRESHACTIVHSQSGLKMKSIRNKKSTELMTLRCVFLHRHPRVQALARFQSRLRIGASEYHEWY